MRISLSSSWCVPSLEHFLFNLLEDHWRFRDPIMSHHQNTDATTRCPGSTLLGQAKPWHGRWNVEKDNERSKHLACCGMIRRHVGQCNFCFGDALLDILTILTSPILSPSYPHLTMLMLNIFLRAVRPETAGEMCDFRVFQRRPVVWNAQLFTWILWNFWQPLAVLKSFAPVAKVRKVGWRQRTKTIESKYQHVPSCTRNIINQVMTKSTNDDSSNPWKFKIVLTLATLGVPFEFVPRAYENQFEHAGSHGKSYENALSDEVDRCCNLNLHSPWYSYHFQLVSICFSMFQLVSVVHLCPSSWSCDNVLVAFGVLRYDGSSMDHPWIIHHPIIENAHRRWGGWSFRPVQSLFSKFPVSPTK